MSKNIKMELANLTCDNDKSLNSSNMTECEKYKMVWGCDKDCPVFQRKECELQEENEQDFFRDKNDMLSYEKFIEKREKIINRMLSTLTKERYDKVCKFAKAETKLRNKIDDVAKEHNKTYDDEGIYIQESQGYFFIIEYCLEQLKNNNFCADNREEQ